jgi:hypothetical protein
LELFTRVESTTFPVDDSQIGSVASDQASPTALPPSPLISVAEAEEQVDFEIAEFSDVPEGFEYLGVRLYGKYVSLDYMTKGYGHLILMQSREGFYQSEWDNVPADAVVAVKIGELDGEMVQDTFVRFPGETFATWNPDASFTRMRWVNNGIWIEIALYGDAHDHLDLAGLIKLAEGLTTQP